MILFRTAIAAATAALLGPLCTSIAFAQADTPPDQTVVVTATRVPERTDALPFGVSVITAAEIHDAGITTVNEALMKLLGVPGRADFYGGGDYALDLRGFGASADNNQVVIVDGVRLSEADLSGTRLAGIPVNQIERIEVIHGSGAVLYGEGATGGVIVITTKGAAGKVRREGELYGSVGTYHTRDLQADASLPLGDVSLELAGSQRESDNQRDNFHSTSGAGSVGAQWQLAPQARVGARLSHDELQTGLPGALSAEQYADNPRQTTTPGDNAAIRNDREGVSGQAQWAGWQWNAEAGWRQKTLHSLSFGFPYDFDVRADNQSLRASRTTRSGELRNTWLAGLDYSTWQRDVAGDFGSQTRQHSSALYAKDAIDLGGTRLDLGARTETLHKWIVGTGPRVDSRQNAWELGLTQTLDAGWTAYGRIGRSFRLPVADEFSYTEPGTSLVPQTSLDSELGARWDDRRSHSQIDMRLYRSALRHEIGYDPTAVGPFGTTGANVNFDPTLRQGIELEARTRLAPTLEARLNAGWRQARFTEGAYQDRRIPLTPRQSTALTLDWQLQPGQRLDAGVRRVSSQSPDFQNQCTIPAYTTADARYSVQWQALEFAVGVDNLADKHYYTQAYGCEGSTPTAIYPEPGRQLNASLRWSFL